MKTYSKHIRIFLISIFIISLLIFSIGCSNASGGQPSKPNDGYTEDLSLITETSSTRKIIYTASLSFTVKDIEIAVNNIIDNLEDSEWVETSSISSNYASLTLRIKTERLDEFLDSIKETGELSNQQISSDDVSIDYYDNEARKETLETEQKALLALMEKASAIDEILTINKRLSEIDTELKKIEGTLNNYDSLIDYSKVTIILRINNVTYSDTFADKLIDAFSVILEILEFFAILLICLLPFAVLAGIIVFIVIFTVNKNKKKKKAKENPEENTKK